MIPLLWTAWSEFVSTFPGKDVEDMTTSKGRLMRPSDGEIVVNRHPAEDFGVIQHRHGTPTDRPEQLVREVIPAHVTDKDTKPGYCRIVGRPTVIS
jgi:hypothetical protein